MLVMKLNVFLLLLTAICGLFGTCSLSCFPSEQLNVCVTNYGGNICEQVSHITTNLSEVSQILQQYNQTCVTLYFTGGLHLLKSNIHFDRTYKNITIVGKSNHSTVIDCQEGGNLNFVSSRGAVLIINVTFEKSPEQMTLFFQNAYLDLKNVNVQNSVHGIVARDCPRIVLSYCMFMNNRNGHMSISYREYAVRSVFLYHEVDVVINIHQSWFCHGSNESGLKIVRSIEVALDATCIIQIVDCFFYNNTDYHLLIKEDHFDGTDQLSIEIIGCMFSDSLFGMSIKQLLQVGGDHQHIMNVSVLDSNVRNNYYRGIEIHDANEVTISNCSICNNRETGLWIIKTCITMYDKSPLVSNVTFFNNSRAIAIGIAFCDLRGRSMMDNARQEVSISNCTFDKNLLGKNTSSVVFLSDTLFINQQNNNYAIIVQIQDSMFKNNHIEEENTPTTTNFDCSVLYAFNLTVVAKNVSFINNTCTGILLNSTTLKLQNLLFQNNYAKHGGAIRIIKNPSQRSMIYIYPNSSLNCYENRATEYGGVIYSEESCEKKRQPCFFQIKALHTLSPTFNFKGNRADKGGDVFFGGCLSGCLQVNSSEIINLNDPKNIFWKLISLSPKDNSQSNFAEHPTRVVFCKNSNDTSRPTCKDEHTLTVYRGGTFTIGMMVAGELCFPSYNIIYARIPQEQGQGVEIRKGGNYQEANPYCEKHTYSLVGGQDNLTNFTINIELDMQEKKFSGNRLTYLTVNYINHCPPGFKLYKNEEVCQCSSLLTSEGVECINSNYSFRVPPLTWIGIWNDQVAVGSSCQYCKASGTQTIENISTSDDLCVEKRRAILCGECIKGYSIKLGRYQCDDCSRSSYLGYILTICFAITGILLILTLLKLNLTVSTGFINCLIFYSNVVYSNHSIFLPLDRNANGGHLNNAVHFLFIFKAWLNLDFGFDVCYFHGTDTYTITWLQFVFPLYIWFLILAIVIVSRYSTRVSMFTGHNTISVLATLLLLSYTKLLSAVLSALSYTQLYLEGKTSIPLWSSDSNIRYMAGKHVWLSLMSLLIILAYIVPFTFLVSLGPLLISKSNYRVLRWIHKIRPFLDAFYGPYTKSFHFWPGILLLLRVLLVCIIAFYSIGDGSFIALSTVVAIVLLFILCQLIMEKTHQVSLHRKKKLNLLELFFFSNLVSFAAITVYLSLKYSKDIRKQQLLAVVMVGSAFFLFCCITVFHIVCAVRSWKTTIKIFEVIGKRKKRTDQEATLDNDCLQTYHDINNRPATRTELELPQHFKGQNEKGQNEIREPLLETSHYN